MIELKENVFFKSKDRREFRQFVTEQDSEKKQDLIQFSDWEFSDDGLKIKGKKYAMRDSAMKLLLRLFKMPVSFYYDTSPTDMLVRDVNRMKAEYTSDSQVRVHWQGKEIRAISSPKVVALENHKPIFEATKLDTLDFLRGDYSDYGIRFVSIDNSIRPVKVEKDDLVEIGNEIMHSDIGYYPSTGMPFLNRLICTNGMVIQEKSPFVSGFSISRMKLMTADQFMANFASGIQGIKSDAKLLTNAFKSMKDHPIADLRLGEPIMKKLRLSIGVDNFDASESLVRKVAQESEKEKVIINTELPLYDALDVCTRLAKKQPYLERRKTERLCGTLIIESANEFVPKEARA